MSEELLAAGLVKQSLATALRRGSGGIHPGSRRPSEKQAGVHAFPYTAAHTHTHTRK